MVEGVRKLTLSKKAGRHGNEQKLERATWDLSPYPFKRKYTFENTVIPLRTH